MERYVQAAAFSNSQPPLINLAYGRVNAAFRGGSSKMPPRRRTYPGPILESYWPASF